MPVMLRRSGMRGAALKIAIDFSTVGLVATYSYLAWNDVWQLGHTYGLFLAYLSAPCHPTRRVVHSICTLCPCCPHRMLIGC